MKYNAGIKKNEMCMCVCVSSYRGERRNGEQKKYWYVKRESSLMLCKACTHFGECL